jgi:hypothetical protein
MTQPSTNALTIRMTEEDERNLTTVAKIAAEKVGPFVNRTKAIRYALRCTAERAQNAEVR